MKKLLFVINIFLNLSINAQIMLNNPDEKLIFYQKDLKNSEFQKLVIIKTASDSENIKFEYHFYALKKDTAYFLGNFVSENFSYLTQISISPNSQFFAFLYYLEGHPLISIFKIIHNKLIEWAQISPYPANLSIEKWQGNNLILKTNAPANFFTVETLYINESTKTPCKIIQINSDLDYSELPENNKTVSIDLESFKIK